MITQKSWWFKILLINQTKKFVNYWLQIASFNEFKKKFLLVKMFQLYQTNLEQIIINRQSDMEGKHFLILNSQ